MKYTKVNTIEYADKLKQQFYDDHSLWYKAILPKEKADELRVKYNGDYSKIWHTHCEECWKTIDKSTGVCYLGDDGISWLCTECYNDEKRK